MNKFSILLMIGLISLTCVGCDSETSKKDNSSSQETVSEDSQNKTQQETDPMNLSLGQSYNDDGVLITVESTEEFDDVTKAKIKIENNSDKDYKTYTNAFVMYNTSEKQINYDKPYETIYETINVKKGEIFTKDIAVKKDNIFRIAYSKSMNVTKPDAKWVIPEAKEAEAKKAEAKKAEEEKTKKSREAGEKARKSYANLLPYPETVKFPFLFDFKNIGTGYYEGGTIKYKNFIGNEVKSEYRMWYNEDGTLTAAELDGKKLK